MSKDSKLIALAAKLDVEGAIKREVAAQIRDALAETTEPAAEASMSLRIPFGVSSPQVLKSPRIPSIEDIKAYLSLKGGRVADLAKQYECSLEEVRRVINSSGGQIRIGDKGWLKVTNSDPSEALPIAEAS
jgi:hypothetical protein